MVSRIDQTKLRATGVDFRASVDISVYDYCHFFWLCRVLVSESQNPFYRASAVSTEYSF